LSYVSSVREYPTYKKFWKRYGSKHSLLIFLTDDFPNIPDSLEDALKNSKDTYLLNPNSVLINQLEKAISNCQQATANMEKFLFICPLKENDSKEIPVSSDVMFEKVAGIDEDTIDIGIVLEDIVPVDIKLDEKEVAEEEIPQLDKQAVRRLHILEIYPVKKRELLKNQEDREALLTSTPEYYNYQNSLSALMNFYEDIGLNDAEKNVLSVQKVINKHIDFRSTCPVLDLAQRGDDTRLV
jgi:hypothetical protein